VARDEARALVSGMVESMVRAWGFTGTKKRDSGPPPPPGPGPGKLNDGRKTKISTGRVLRARDAGVSKHHGGKKMVSTKQSSISSARKKRIAQLVETCKRKQENRRERISGHGRHPPHGNEGSSGGAVGNISEPTISNVPWIDDTADLDYEDGTDGEYELGSITESASSGQNLDWTGDSDDADGIDGDGDGELRDNK
jgi:hypothetical protein